MVADTSAILAILLNEPDAVVFATAIEGADTRLISAGTLLESSLVVEARFAEAGGRELDLLLHRAEFEVVPVDSDQVELARAAYRRFGKGRHPAGLNFGDCFAYALAVSLGEPLLFKGGDFRLTDVSSVL
jgi:ribonuclease VapC